MIVWIPAPLSWSINAVDLSRYVPQIVVGERVVKNPATAAEVSEVSS